MGLVQDFRPSISVTRAYIENKGNPGFFLYFFQGSPVGETPFYIKTALAAFKCNIIISDNFDFGYLSFSCHFDLYLTRFFPTIFLRNPMA